MEPKVHSANQKPGHHFTYLDNDNIQRRMNKQSGFNAEQINKDKNPESKNRLKIKSKITSNHKKTKPLDYYQSTSNNKRRSHISQSFPLSS